MNTPDRYNSERYLDMTCFLALRNIEKTERKERRNRMRENWIYRRGDVYLANLDPYIGSEQGGTRPGGPAKQHRQLLLPHADRRAHHVQGR